MEVAVYTVIGGAWWVASATVMLPFLCILKYNKFLRDRWFSFFFLRVLKPVFEPKMFFLREKTFDILKKNLPKHSSSNPLKILEIGIGGGANLELYPENCILTALDMNDSFGPYFQKNRAKYPHIEVDRVITAFAENMKEVEDSSMDVVISTYVLCSVKSVEDCMREIKRVLKPGGKFLFLEHMAFPKSDRRFSLQKMVSPLWFIYFDGCNLTRHLTEDIKKAGFSDVNCEIIYPKEFAIFFRPQTYGLATK